MSGKHKGARRMADVSPQRRAALSHGTEQTKTLVEAFVIDMARLLSKVYPELEKVAETQIKPEDSFTQRMRSAGELVLEHKGLSAFDTLANHPSDTVRGWSAYLLAAAPNLSLVQLLSRIRPLADDEHFGVREWAWLAIRPSLVSDIPLAINTLQPWTREHSANLRRYAVESMRPRGVWCAHIPELKEHPEPALPLLEPLRADPARYVQDSVANWLNDAAKNNPGWVRKLCARWLLESDAPETQYICKRAMRSLNKKPKKQ